MKRAIFTAAAMLFMTGHVLAVHDELDSASVIDVTQPPQELVERIEAQPQLGENGAQMLVDFERDQYPYRLANVLMQDGLPYYPYYALREGSNYVIHPMALGRFLLRNAEGEAATETLQAALNIAHKLPNGGLAWYYPRHYQVARMLGDNLKYSSISQGTILSGLTGLSEAGVISTEPARGAFKAMLWPFEKGGVNLAGRAVLEMPSFAGPPEIILNGWIDALLHIRDYGEITGDLEAVEFFRTNVSFLAEILPNFDSPENHISRYSDTSPYRVKVRLASADDVDTLQVLYRPKIDGLPEIRVPLKNTKNTEDFSVYENQIFRQNGREAFVWLSCSQLYETVLVSRSSEMSVSISTGTVNRKSTTPGYEGRDVVLESEQDGELRTTEITGNDDLICGYPTNFSKGGTTNYYHVYHVVGLLLIAMSNEVPDEERRTLIEWALRWKEDIGIIQETEGLKFHPIDEMIADINANQSKVTYSDFNVLLDDAERFLKSQSE